jgi:hypothetical protein
MGNFAMVRDTRRADTRSLTRGPREPSLRAANLAAAFLICSIAFAKMTLPVHCGELKIQPVFRDGVVTLFVDGRLIDSVNVSEYQLGHSIGSADLVIGPTSVAIRLGRDKDMFMISAFRAEANGLICVKHLMVRLRDGKQIRIELIFGKPGKEIYGITFGRAGDLYNEYGISYDSFTFVFDPRVPRTGRNRNPDVPITLVREHDVLDRGCK